MKEILTIQDVISLENKNIVDYLAYSFYRMPNDLPYPSKQASFIIIENANELTHMKDTPLTHCVIPRFEDFADSIEIIEHNTTLEITEVVIITDYTLSHAFSLIIENRIINDSKELTKLINPASV